ncbi:MAG: methylenetetrahydrofolate reductase [Acidimicrobiales bacterium]
MRGGLGRTAARTRLAPILAHPRYEVIPATTTEDKVLDAVGKDVTITVTASPSKGLEATIALAERLAGRGYEVVPHVSARLLTDSGHLRDVAARLRAAGVSDIFVPAGDSARPAGAFDDALGVLEELKEIDDPFERIGITGYPESHPQVDDDVTIQAMWDKRRYADYIVSNLCFDTKVLSRWIRRVRARGVSLPMYVGMAGPIEATKLVAMAAKIGLAESSRFAGKHFGWVARMGTPGGYDPDRFLERLSSTLADPALAVAGVHVFTFNQVAETEAWRRSMLS